MPTLDEQFMSIALEIAQNGRGAVEPNPMVGAVLVRDGAEVSRGWHKRFGWPHAEVEAFAAAEAKGEDPDGATLYVSLEPCCPFGASGGKKTPPCTRAIIEAGVSRVVAAMADPDERVAGKGFDELRRAGVKVTVGVLESRARDMLAPYVKLRKSKRPWVICKWAQTSDGLLGVPPGQGRWISCEASRQDAHRLRGLCEGILVGIGTVLADDPMLTNRSATTPLPLGEVPPSGGGRGPHPTLSHRERGFPSTQGKQPTRVVLDAHLRIPPGAWLLQTAGAVPLIVATTLEGLAANPGRGEELRRCGAEVLQLPGAPEGVSLAALLDDLGRRQWTYLLVEGGANVLRSFIYGRLADELTVYIAPVTGGPVGGPRFDLAQVLADLAFAPVEERVIGVDRVRRLRAKG
jgi:diaminohydroxyphosphoribosylaminopyrimidine deaminase/5-amino-6-(5-phosphoribosylamino)uracil reductase